MKRQIVNDAEEFKTFVKRFNNKMNCYTSVYDYRRFGENEAIVSSVLLDRLFLDFDSHGKDLQLSLDDVKSVIEYLDEINYTYEIYFSVNGFHVFVMGNVAESIRDIQQFFYKLYPKATNGTLDKSGVQTRRLRRIPNTVNMNTEEFLYCVPLEKSNLESIDAVWIYPCPLA